MQNISSLVFTGIARSNAYRTLKLFAVLILAGALFSTTARAQDQNAQGGEGALGPGVFYFDAAANTYPEIDAALFTNTKSGGLGENLLRTSVSGLINAKVKASISNVEANLKIKNPSPLFVFVIDIANNKDGPNIKSPNEIMLVKLTPGKNDRELVIGKSNSVGSDMGIEDKVKIPFTYNKVQKGMYELSVNSPLPVGEYCFLYGTPSQNGPIYTVYDFSIRK